MVQMNDLTGDERRRLSDQYETLLRSMITLRADHVSAAQIGQIVDRATAAASPTEARSLIPSTSAVNLLKQFLLETIETGTNRRPTNFYSPEGVRAAIRGDGAKGGLKRGDVDPLNLSFSSARFRDIDIAGRYSGLNIPAFGGDIPLKPPAEFDWGSPAGLAKMREYALQSGLPWAANNPELLRLGPAAIGTLAAVHFKQETYKRLTTDASFKAKDVVTLAHFAKDKHVDANLLGGAIAGAEKPLSQPERERLNGAIVPYMADPKDAKKRDNAAKAFYEAAKAHPDDRPALDRARELLQIKDKELNHEHKAADGKDRRAAGKEAGATDQLAALDTLASDPTPQAPAARKGDKPKAAAQPPSPSSPKTTPQKAATPAPH